MDQRVARQQAAGGVDRGDHRLVGVAGLAVRPIDRAAGEQRHARQIDPVRPDRVRHRQPVRLAQFEIVGAMARRDVDETGALVGLDKARRQQRHVEFVALAGERMARDGAGERRARKARLHRIRLDAAAGGDLVGERGGDQQGLARTARGCPRPRGRPASRRNRAPALNAIARLPGRVHGVVVQITAAASTSAGRPVVTIGNRTQTVVERWSWYSTSASASAVCSTTDHSTGFEPR